MRTQRPAGDRSLTAVLMDECIGARSVRRSFELSSSLLYTVILTFMHPSADKAAEPALTTGSGLGVLLTRTRNDVREGWMSPGRMLQQDPLQSSDVAL
jgi:hypothetical protein